MQQSRIDTIKMYSELKAGFPSTEEYFRVQEGQ